MTQEDICRKKFDELQTCVIIPTYNNAHTLGRVIEEVAAFTTNIQVVNDGSTDHTLSILQALPSIKHISYPRNRGKGWAIRQGLCSAARQGFLHAITMDSDGQHFAKDLPRFLEQIETQGPAIIIGSRDMDQESVPGKSSFGRKFSNFWFKLETGITCPDTQSGYRSYPLSPLKNMRFVTRKYEFEIEILVRLAWKGVAVHSVPIDVFYPPSGERISHFRPFRDFLRISVLNTVLVLLALGYFWPRNFFRSMLRKRNWKQTILTQLLGTHQSKLKKASSVAFGVFMGILPLWGFQLVLAIFLSILLKLNKALVIIFANISIPPMIPLILYLSYKTGAFWIHGDSVSLSLTNHIGLDSIWFHFKQYVYGSISLAVLAGAMAGFLAFALLSILQRKKRPAV